MKKLALCACLVLGLAAGAGSISPMRSTAAQSIKITDATLYRVELKGTASVAAIGNTDGKNPNTRYNHTALTASWTFEPKPTKIWLANVEGGTLVTKAEAADNTENSGAIQATEKFTWFDPQDSSATPQSGDSDCHGTVKNQINVKYEADATQGGTNLTVDLAGIFRTAMGAEVPCENTPDKRNSAKVEGQLTPYSAFAFTWDPTKAPTIRQPGDAEPPNQKMELIDSLLRFQIGRPSPAVLLKDASHVTDAQNCSNLFVQDCNVTFHLRNIDFTLTKICGGTLGTDGQGTCTGGGGSGKKNPPTTTTTPSNGPPAISNLKVTPHAFKPSAGANITYRINQVPTQTQFTISGKLTVAGHTIGPVPLQLFKHTNTAKSVSVALHPSFGGKPFQPGTYTVEARPLNLRTDTPGRPVDATFVITK